MFSESVNVKHLVLLLLKSFRKPIERRMVHFHLHELATLLNVKLLFYGEQPFSPELEKEIDAMIGEGLLKQIFTVGPLFTELYREYLVFTDKGRKIADELSHPELEKIIGDYVATKTTRGGVPGEQ
ncbi:MAG: hypothetical protein NZ954_03950 [Thermofilaceae archaeon]|nr:hypothetical protein [Thermofilaceae archaeon]MCX8180832.1 hypothetical protein [Thermofilaceae archaeon]MDW8004618.1 hypothetical protein [Thermofilaceae archaeon]